MLYHLRPHPRPHSPRGFTLLELLVVLFIVALAAGAVSVALRDGPSQQLEREAQRLVAWLEAGRAQSRASGAALHWQSTASGFEFVGAAAATAGPGAQTNPLDQAGQSNDLSRPKNWLHPGVQAQVLRPAQAQVLRLGPEPIIAAQTLSLRLGEHEIRIGSNGASPFAILPTGQGQP